MYNIDGSFLPNIIDNSSSFTILILESNKVAFKYTRKLPIQKIEKTDTITFDFSFVFNVKIQDNSVINTITNITDNVYVDVNDNVNVNDNVINTNNTNNIYDYLQENFGRMLRPAEIEQVEKWEDNEVTRYAIKQAILNGAYTCSYIDSILYNYKMNNITTIQQAQEAEKKFRKQKEEQNKYKGMSYREREYLRGQEILEQWAKEGE